MSTEAWIMLALIGAGLFGGVTCFVLFVPKEAAWSSLPTRPVWMVLLTGGIEGREGPDGPDDVWSDRPPSPPRPPSRSVHADQTEAKREVAT
jgi:hypothetical protein